MMEIFGTHGNNQFGDFFTVLAVGGCYWTVAKRTIIDRCSSELFPHLPRKYFAFTASKYFPRPG